MTRVHHAPAGGHTGRPPAAAEPSNGAAPAAHYDAWGADLRSQVIERMGQMNARHADTAWSRRHRDPIGPHALAFFYCEPQRADNLRFGLRTATRLFLDGPEVANAQRLLFDLTEIARGLAEADGFDPRTQLSDRSEPMSARATFIGIGLSTLDTPRGNWVQTQQEVTTALGVPGRCLIYLNDGAMALVDRGPHHELDNVVIRCTHPIDLIPGRSSRRWIYDPDLAALNDPATAPIWLRLHDLLYVIWQASYGR